MKNKIARFMTTKKPSNPHPGRITRKMYLQMYAGDDGAGGEGGEEGTGGGEDEGSEEGKGKEAGGGKTFTQADVDKIVAERIAREKKANEKAIKEAKEEAAKLAKMNEDQKKEYEAQKKDKQIADLQAENESLKREAMKSELGKTVSAELMAAGFPATPDVLEFIVGDDAETTQARKESFIAILEADRKAQAVKRATGKTPQSYKNKGKEDPFDKVLNKYKT